MKKIAFINIFRGVGGGGEVYLSRLINNLAKSIDAESFLISPKCKVLDSVLVKKKCISGVSMNLTAYTIFEMLKSIIEINCILKRERADIVIINGDRAILLSPFLFNIPKKIGIKHMLILSKLKFYLNFLPFSLLDRIVTISNFHIKNYLSFGHEKFFVDKLSMIYNSVDVNHFDVKQTKSHYKIITFVEVASLDKRKGQLDLLVAFERLCKKYENIHLNFIGIGKSEREYKDFVETRGLENSVSFYGFQSDVKSFLSLDNSVFVLPSYDEGLPIVLLEAMSCGLPVISTSIAGIPEIIDQKINGFLFIPGDIKMLEMHMEYFIKNPDQITKMGIKGRSKVVAVFNEEEWKKQWLALL